MNSISENTIYNFIKGLTNEEKKTYFKIINKLERRFDKNGSVELVFKKGRKALCLTDEEKERKKAENNLICRDRARRKAVDKKLLLSQ